MCMQRNVRDSSVGFKSATSLTTKQAASPICLAKFRILKPPRNADKVHRSVRNDAEMFSHLDVKGLPVHRLIEGDKPHCNGERLHVKCRCRT